MLRLRQLREQRRLNQEGLALELNVSQSTISAYELGERTPDLETLISIAGFFNVSLDYLTGLSDTRVPISQNDLSRDEIQHILIYRSLNQHDKEKIDAYIEGYLQGKSLSGQDKR